MADRALFFPLLQIDILASGHPHSIREQVFYTFYLLLLHMGQQGRCKCSREDRS